MQEAGLADLVEIRVGEARTVLELMQGTFLKLYTIIIDRDVIFSVSMVELEQPATCNRSHFQTLSERLTFTY
jgi:hypothetical protein